VIRSGLNKERHQDGQSGSGNYDIPAGRPPRIAAKRTAAIRALSETLTARSGRRD